MRFTRTCWLLSFVFGALSASAQQPPAPAEAAGHGVMMGAVVDSIRGGVLSGALVVVEATGRTTITDADGRFTIDSVPAGEHRLVLLADLLDTLSLRVVTPLLRVTAGDTTGVIMSIPSAETVVHAKCGPGPFPLGGAALIGIVIDAATEKRVADAEIVLGWSEVHASREIGVRQIPRQRSVKSAQDGTFRICGLPPDLGGELIASRGTDTTAAVPFRFDRPPLGVYTLALPGEPPEAVATVDSAGQAVTRSPKPGAPRARKGRATLRGVVTKTTGAPISGARVSVTGAEGVALTNDRGAFVLSGQPSGSQVVLVRRLGYQPAEFAVNLTPARPIEVEVEMPDFVPTLTEVVVRATLDQGLDRVGYTQRERRGMGRYMGLAEIEKRGALRIEDLLAGFPMLRTMPGEFGRRVVVGRGRGGNFGCVSFVVDGMPWLGEDQPTEFMHPQELAGIEVYTSGTTPAEFTRVGNSSCETVVMWTKTRLGGR